MTPSQVKLLEPYFDAKEITATGAKLGDVPYELMRCLMEYRKAIGVPVWLIRGGLTSGRHEENSYHFRPEGAVDFYHADPVKADRAVEVLLEVGFAGIGVYWNGSVRSYHADRREVVTLWRGVKQPGEMKWTYGDLVQVP